MKISVNFKKCLFNRLRVNGFVSKGNFAWRSMNDTTVIVGFQSDAKYGKKDAIRFTIDIYISVDALREAGLTQLAPFLGALAFDDFHWNQRLGRLLPAQADVWWSVHDEETSKIVCDEIAAALLDIALPAVYPLASSDALVSCWKKGYGPGLTEYVRRLNLAKLLLALGRVEEGREAVAALEDASIGKSWEASAAYDAKQLRQLIG